MSKLGTVVLVAALGGTAHAEPAAEVNLLRAAPSAVAVSSTVDNARIPPEHLLDGNLATAWNSRTGELVGAWIAVRLPVDVHVTTITLTAGFTKRDKQGDLFTMNPRIRKLRLSRGGKVVSEHVLDVDDRGLQAIPVNGPGGELELRVLEVVPGTKASWREVCVSELEVRGTVRTPAAQAQRPDLRIGSLDAPRTLTAPECAKAVFPRGRGGRIGPEPDDDRIVATEVVAISPDLAVCRIDHAQPEATETTTAIAVVKRRPRPVLVATETATTTTEERPDEGGGDRGRVTVEPFPLTTTETALLVHVTASKYGPMMDDGTTSSTLYRVSATGLTPVLAFASTWSNGEADDSDRCELRRPVLRKALPDLVLACEVSEGRWHGQDPRGNGEFRTARTERYRWKSGAYQRR